MSKNFREDNLLIKIFIWIINILKFWTKLIKASWYCFLRILIEILHFFWIVNSIKSFTAIEQLWQILWSPIWNCPLIFFRLKFRNFLFSFFLFCCWWLLFFIFFAISRFYFLNYSYYWFWEFFIFYIALIIHFWL
jgi:hypothetical protein